MPLPAGAKRESRCFPNGPLARWQAATQDGGIDSVRVLFWTRNHFAQQQLITALSALPVHLSVADSLADVLEGLATADMMVSSDCDPEQAAVLAPAIAASPVRWFQFLSAGRERLLAAGLPDRLELFGI